MPNEFDIDHYYKIPQATFPYLQKISDKEDILW